MIHRVRHRSARAALAALVPAAVLLVGAAGVEAATVATTAPDGESSLLPPAEGTTEYPLTLSTIYGETVLEERPERVAVIGFSPNFDALELLAVTPVYALTPDLDVNDPEWVAGIEFVDTATRSDPINFEGIAATNPDVIIALNFVWEQGDYDRLASIAPVLEREEEVAGDQTDWRADQRRIGEVLDLAAAADAVVDAADARIAAVVAENEAFVGKTVTVAMDYGEQWGINYYTVTGGTAEGILGELGFVPNPLAEQFVDDAVVSEERLTELDADILLFFYFEPEVQEQREAGELFQTIPAVADGRYVGLNYDVDLVDAPYTIWTLRRGASAITVPAVLEVLAEHLGSVAAG